MITLENYEIWMVDYLDGNLSNTDQALLFQFLENHPHLKEELHGLDKLILQAHEETFGDASSLLKAPEAFGDMTYPDYIAAKELETGLDEDEKQWKAAYIQKNEDHAKLFSLYRKTLLKVDRSIQFQWKASIKRVSLLPTFQQNRFRKLSAAAILAILLSVGAWPFLSKSTDKLQTMVVNDSPSLITMPKSKQSTPQGSAVNTQKETNPSQAITSPNRTMTKIAQQQTIKKEKYKPIPKKEIQALETEKINAYELGLNAMMPFVIAHNITMSQRNYLAKKEQVKEEGMRLSKSARAIASGVKVINFLSGNETKFKKVINQDGVMIAYEVQSDNISIKQKIKNKPVTN